MWESDRILHRTHDALSDFTIRICAIQPLKSAISLWNSRSEKKKLKSVRMRNRIVMARERFAFRAKTTTSTAAIPLQRVLGVIFRARPTFRLATVKIWWGTIGLWRFFVPKFRDRARPTDQKIAKTPKWDEPKTEGPGYPTEGVP